MADERKYYCFCDSNCKFETLTREQILTAIKQAVETGEIHDVDSGFITTVKTIDNKSVKFFFGTEAEYNALGEEKRKNLIPYKTDDSTVKSIEALIETTKAEINAHTVPRMAVLDNVLLETRPHSKELYDILAARDRVYAEKPNNRQVNPLYYISANHDALFDPWGYDSLEEMCKPFGWNVKTITNYKNKQYIEVTVDGKTTYHTRLQSVPVRTMDGNVRVNKTPYDSTDATSKSYVDSKFGGATVAAQTDYNKTNITIPLRDKKGEMRCIITDELNADGKTPLYDSTACVNKKYLLDKLKGYVPKSVYTDWQELKFTFSNPELVYYGEAQCRLDEGIYDCITVIFYGNASMNTMYHFTFCVETTCATRAVFRTEYYEDVEFGYSPTGFSAHIHFTSNVESRQLLSCRVRKIRDL